jgi:hypothetical protein
MENTIMIVGFAAIIIGLAVLGVAEAYIIRTSHDIAAIQRAIFLQLRRQYHDIDRDLKELKDLLQEQKATP